ncbi:hypothetical protein OA2633_09549 [Oceanicaulis sp. HTCC2633]|nr:hypothetical protein OA2633_09549 [Oceanicaulis sp. HTCC2633]
MPPETMSLRVFAALPLSDTVADQACAEMTGVPDANWRPRENLHITLCFYGELDEPVIEELDSALGQVRLAPFELRLEGAGRFGGGDPSAIWLGVEHHPALMDLARQCRKAARQAGVEIEKRAYLPHLTLAYLNRDVDMGRVQRFEQRLGLFKSVPFTVDRFHLYSSWARKPHTPNLYRIETEYPLIA